MSVYAIFVANYSSCFTSSNNGLVKVATLSISRNNCRDWFKVCCVCEFTLLYNEAWAFNWFIAHIWVKTLIISSSFKMLLWLIQESFSIFICNHATRFFNLFGHYLMVNVVISYWINTNSLSCKSISFVLVFRLFLLRCFCNKNCIIFIICAILNIFRLVSKLHNNRGFFRLACYLLLRFHGNVSLFNLDVICIKNSSFLRNRLLYRLWFRLNFWLFFQNFLFFRFLIVRVFLWRFILFWNLQNLRFWFK